MGTPNWDRHTIAMLQRGRGRPSSATQEQKNNNYCNPDGTYALTDGLKPWHVRIVDYMILKPNAKIVDIAKEFDVTPQWIGKLIKTDAFKEYYNSRLEDHQAYLSVNIVAKMQGVAVKALDRMAEKMDGDAVTIGQLKDVAELSLKGLGYMQNSGASVTINQQNNNITSIPVGSEVLARARERLAEKMRDNTKALEHDPTQYGSVTSALEMNAEDIEDAHVISSDDDE